MNLTEAPATVVSVSQGRWILVTTVLASSVVFIDMTIVNLALPSMQHELSSSFSTMQWVVEAYVLLLTGLMLVGGGMADAFGRRRILCIGAAVFALASLAAGLSTSASQLIAARALQGIGGACLAHASLASFGPHERGKALGIWAAFAGAATAIAPPLGGMLVEFWSWRGVFYINLPLLAVVICIALWKVPDSRDEQRPKNLDLAGALCAIVALGALTYALLSAGQSSLNNMTTLVSFAVAFSFGCLFVVVERRVPHPMLPLSIFSVREFTGLNMMTLVLFTAVGAVMFFLPMTLIQAFQYSPAEAGAAVIPSMAAMFVVSPLMGRFTDRFGARLPIIIGPLISALAYVSFTFLRSGEYWDGVWLSILLMGIGFGSWVTPLTTAVMNAVGPNQTGIVSGINNAVARLAQLLAIAILGLVAARTFNATLDASVLVFTDGAGWLELLGNERTKLGVARAPQSLSLLTQE